LISSLKSFIVSFQNCPFWN